MKTNFTRLLSLAALFFMVFNVSAQDAYRTNVTDGVASQWLTPGNWQRFDTPTSTWVTATSFPTSADGVITIQTGDTLQLTGAGSNISIDQVVIEPGAVLVIFNTTSGTVTLNDGAGDDISVLGRFYVATGGTITGSSTSHIQIQNGGQFTLRNTGVLAAPLSNDGTIIFGLASPAQVAGTILSTTVVNNDSLVWANGNSALSTNASFTNNGLILFNSITSNWNTTGTNTLTNNGTIRNLTTNTLQIFVPLTNTGTFSGTGTFQLNNVTSNTGILSPGTSPGVMTVSPAAITSRTPSINIELASDGAVAGTNYDQLNVNGAVNVSGATLNMTNSTTTAEPVGTTYTILTSTGAITGTFATTNIPTNFTLTYNTNSIVATKIALFPLPVSWGSFNAVSQGNKVALDWTTMMEENTSYFIVEHSTNGSSFTGVATVQAQGNSTYEAKYKYIFASPDLTKNNYFRIKQVDIDGKSSYSATRSVKFDKGQVVALQVYPNPVKDVLQLNIQRANIQVLLVDQTGKTVQQLSLQQGQHTIDMASMPTGIYQLAIFEKGIRIDTKKIMKQ